MSNSAAVSKVVIVGQGYVGLPIAMRAVEVGHNVVGIDLDLNRTNALKDGRSFVEDISNDEVQAALDSGRYQATADYEDVKDFDIAVVTVPTPLKETLPDLSMVEASARSLAPFVRKGSTVILESTTYPGTTEELMIPILEEGSGLKAGDDFFVGYSPERIDPGNQTWMLKNTPKVVSGIDPTSLEHVKNFYDSICDSTVPVSGTKEAELTKLLENTFRHVNIALVNELAIFANQLGVNVWESIDAAATKPFGFMKFTPGPGVGGHCLPIDPSYLSWQVRRSLGENFRFVELANDINEHMPAYAIQRLTRLLNTARRSVAGSTVVVLGVAYKKNSSDARESPANKVIELLQELDANVVVVDGFIDTSRLPAGVEAKTIEQAIADGFDAAVLVTDHDDVDYEALIATGKPILDTRNKLSGANVETL